MSLHILFVSRKDNRGGAIYEEEVKNILTRSFPIDTLNLDSGKNNWLFFTKLKYFFQIKSFKIQQPYTTLIANRAGVYAGIFTKGFKKKILVIHHYNSKENGYPVIRNILKMRFFSAINNFDHVVVVSEYWKDFIGKYVDPGKVRVIHNSFDIKTIENISIQLNKNDFKARYNIPNDKIIVYAGNALKVKGFMDVIAKLDPDKYFIITSGGKDGPINHLHLSLDYTGYIQLLCVSDVTVILSKLEEGWNRIAHESMLCGTPVIGNGIAGLGELLRNAEQLIYNQDQDLGALISEVMRNQQYTEKGKQYVSQFDLQYFEEKWKSLVSS